MATSAYASLQPRSGLIDESDSHELDSLEVAQGDTLASPNAEDKDTTTALASSSPGLRVETLRASDEEGTCPSGANFSPQGFHPFRKLNVDRPPSRLQIAGS